MVALSQITEVLHMTVVTYMGNKCNIAYDIYGSMLNITVVLHIRRWIIFQNTTIIYTSMHYVLIMVFVFNVYTLYDKYTVA